jgi:hypothetical protein
MCLLFLAASALAITTEPATTSGNEKPGYLAILCLPLPTEVEEID